PIPGLEHRITAVVDELDVDVADILVAGGVLSGEDGTPDLGVVDVVVDGIPNARQPRRPGTHQRRTTVAGAAVAAYPGHPARLADMTGHATQGHEHLGPRVAVVNASRGPRRQESHPLGRADLPGE